MKSTNCFRIWAGILAAVALVGAAQAKKSSVGLEAFEGSYKANGGFFVFSSTTGSIQAAITVKVPKSGKSATVTVSGFAAANGSTLPVSNTLVFTPKSAVLSDVLFGIVGSNAVPGSGKATLNKKGSRLNYTLSVAVAPTALINGSMQVQPLGKKKKKLTLNLFINASGSIINFQVIGVAKVKPENENEKD